MDCVRCGGRLYLIDGTASRWRFASQSSSSSTVYSAVKRARVPDDVPGLDGVPFLTNAELFERSDPASSLETFGSSFGSMLPREQVMLFQQMLVFNQMVGRMIAANSKYAYEKDYNDLIQLLCTPWVPPTEQPLQITWCGCVNNALDGMSLSRTPRPQAVWIARRRAPPPRCCSCCTRRPRALPAR